MGTPHTIVVTAGTGGAMVLHSAYDGQADNVVPLLQDHITAVETATVAEHEAQPVVLARKLITSLTSRYDRHQHVSSCTDPTRLVHASPYDAHRGYVIDTSRRTIVITDCSGNVLATIGFGVHLSQALLYTVQWMEIAQDDVEVVAMRDNEVILRDRTKTTTNDKET